MKNIMANSLRIFTRSKDYISMVVVVPIVIFLLMTILLPYTKNHSIAVINKTDDTAMEDALEHLDGIDIQDIDEDDIAKRIVGGNIDLAVIIDETEEGLVYAQVISAGETEISGAVNLAIQNAKDTENTDNSVTVNADDRGRRSMGNSSAFMIYKFLQGGSLLGVYIIMERKRRMKERILLSGIHSATYITGMSIIFFIGNVIGAGIYYLTAVLLDFDFGMKNSLDYFLMLIIACVFGVAFAVFIAGVTNDEETNNNISMVILTVLGFFSGIFFPYEYMPKGFKAIGNISPQHWASHGIEQIQKTGSLSSAATDIVLLLSASVVLYVIGVWLCGRKHAK